MPFFRAGSVIPHIQYVGHVTTQELTDALASAVNLTCHTGEATLQMADHCPGMCFFRK